MCINHIDVINDVIPISAENAGKFSVVTGSALWAVYTSRIYGLPVLTTHVYGPHIRAIYMGSVYQVLGRPLTIAQCGRRNHSK